MRESGSSTYSPNEGDVLRVFGQVTQTSGLIEFNVDSIQILDTAFTLPAPAVVTTIDESTEGRLIRINGLSLASPSQWTGIGSEFNVDLIDGSNSFRAKIINQVTLFNDPAPTTQFDLIGHGFQRSTNIVNPPFNDGYYISPRYSEDLIPDSTSPPITPVVVQRYTISSLRSVDANGIADSLGVICSIAGIVSGGNLKSNGVEFWFIDSTNSAGILVRQAGFISYSPTEGDVLEVFGVVGQSQGLTTFSVDSLDVLGTNFTLPQPVVISTLDKSTEGGLIEIQNVTLVNPIQWTSTGSNFFVDVTDGSNVHQVNVLDATTLYNDSVPNGVFNLRGHGSQLATSLPLLYNYFIQPRYTEDLIFTMSIDNNTLLKIKAYPNPTHKHVTFELSSKEPAEISVFSVSGQKIYHGKIDGGHETLDTRQWTSGVYIARITQSNRMTNIQILVQ